MEIKEAFWEKRNLGIDVCEIIISKSDTEEKISNNLDKLKSNFKYLVAKVPINNIDSLFLLQRKNFKFIEQIFICSHNLNEPNFSSLQKRVLDHVGHQIMKKSEKKELQNFILDGLFKEDRISLDSHFKKDLSNKRYLGLIEDEVSQGAEIYSLTFKGKTSGFFVARELENRILFASIGGIYPKFQGFGLGLGLNYQEIILARNHNLRKVRTIYSSNNIGASSVHHQLAYDIENQYYVLIKHVP